MLQTIVVIYKQLQQVPQKDYSLILIYTTFHANCPMPSVSL